jgi:hypothetical protein
MTTDGPVLDIMIGVSAPRAAALRAQGKPIPARRKIRGLVDTGASSTCIDKPHLEALDLAPRGCVPVKTPSTGSSPCMCSQFDISFLLLYAGQTITISAIPVLEVDLSAQNIDALIGRDVLSRCLLVCDGAAGTFSIAV